MAVHKTPISMLQELTVAKRQPLPTYSIKSVGNELQPKFLCSVQISSFTTSAVARNKKDAKQFAADRALIELGYKVSPLKEISSRKTNIESSLPNISTTSQRNYSGCKNYIGELQEFLVGCGQSYPIYESILSTKNGQFKYICKFETFKTVGYATDKKRAKQIASYKMISKLKSGEFNATAPTPSKNKSLLLSSTKYEDEVVDKFEKLSFGKKDYQALPPHLKNYPENEEHMVLKEVQFLKKQVGGLHGEMRKSKKILNKIVDQFSPKIKHCSKESGIDLM